jgi:hypothetical protein
MIEAEFDLSVLPLTSMDTVSTTLRIPWLSAACPALTPQTMLAAEFEPASVMQADLFVVSIHQVLLCASPVGAYHLIVRLGVCRFLAPLPLLHDDFGNVTWMSMTDL